MKRLLVPAVALLLLAVLGAPASAAQTPTDRDWKSAVVGTDDGLDYAPTPDVNFALSSDARLSGAAVAGGCHGHADTPTFNGSARTIYVQGYIECTEPADIDVLTRPQIYTKVSGVWKWVNAGPYFYQHRIDWRVWSMGAMSCTSTSYRHWRTLSYGHVNGVATRVATSIDITIPC
ncbi:hypothetical protein [Pedococcus sp. P5_B7]